MIKVEIIEVVKGSQYRVIVSDDVSKKIISDDIIPASSAKDAEDLIISLMKKAQ